MSSFLMVFCLAFSSFAFSVIVISSFSAKHTPSVKTFHPVNLFFTILIMSRFPEHLEVYSSLFLHSISKSHNDSFKADCVLSVISVSVNDSFPVSLGKVVVVVFSSPPPVVLHSEGHFSQLASPSFTTT